MKCRFCLYVGQYLLNWLVYIDLGINCLLLGNPRETISFRAAKARKAGQVWPIKFCRLLTFLTYCCTFGKVTGDHCDHALRHEDVSNANEIWNWSDNSINKLPEIIKFDSEIIYDPQHPIFY